MCLSEVTDYDLGTPALKKAEDTDTSGRGVCLVEACSYEWGVRYNEDQTKIVWAKIGK